MKSRFKLNSIYIGFNKQERNGVFFLLLLIVVLQLTYFWLRYLNPKENANFFQIDQENQSVMDSLVLASNHPVNNTINPFNPNYIKDFKAYSLGMSVEETDRLFAYRSQNKYVNSVEEFQSVTLISDSLLEKISPFFRFPNWVKTDVSTKKQTLKIKEATEIKDLNTVAIEDLKQIWGIGDKLSERIIKFRDRLGGFLINDQLYDVYGLKPEVVNRVLQKFQVLRPPDITKININTASADELASLVYLKYAVAQNIVRFRAENGKYRSLEELFNVYEFPIDKMDKIRLYLSY